MRFECYAYKRKKISKICALVALSLLTCILLQTLDIVAENPDKFKIVALAAGSNITLLAEQVPFNFFEFYVLNLRFG